MADIKTRAPGSGAGAHAGPSSILLSRDQIEERVYDLAQSIDEHYKMHEFTMLVVMDGAMVFASRLMGAIRGPFQVESIKCKSYVQGAPGSILKITQDVAVVGSRILIVEDIIESGRTMRALKNRIMMEDREVKVVSLVEREHHDPVADWTGFRVGPGFIYGYGLDDEKGRGRGLKDIWVMGVDLGRSR